MKIYVASSWRNERQPTVVRRLRDEGHEVYDFRNPKPGYEGFAWSDIDPYWKQWSPGQFAKSLEHPIARSWFMLDFDAMKWADVFVLVMPCGMSAHLEAGWAIGSGKPTAILLSSAEPELMYNLADTVCTTLDEVVDYLGLVGQ